VSNGPAFVLRGFAGLLLPLCCVAAATGQTPDAANPGATNKATPNAAEQQAQPDITQPDVGKTQSTHRLSIPKRRRHQATTTAVHKAWLKEIIDLDRDGAVLAYDNILRDSPREQPERWIAVARLRELVRLGVLRPEPMTSHGQEPPDVKAALALLDEPFPFEDVLRDPDSDDELPPLRPATPLVQSWVRDQIGLTMQERYAAMVRPQRYSSGEIRRWRINDVMRDVMRRELEGNRPQADALRAIYFVNWTPMTVTGPRQEVLKEAMQRLTKWIETEEDSFTRVELRALETGVAKIVEDGDTREDGANNAVELIRRLPNYSSKLLGEPTKDAADKPADAPK